LRLEITGPIIAITLVLLSVFVPIGFIPGITGALYRQFAVAVSAAVIISAINALTLRRGRPAARRVGNPHRRVFEANQQPELTNVFSTCVANSPQVYLDIDRNKAQILGVPVSDIFQALQATMGGYFINQFNLYGRVWQVNVQAEARDRGRFNDFYRVNVASAKGGMIPLRALMTASIVVGPQLVRRYNNLRAVAINGSAARGHSSGEALAAMERASRKALPPGYGFEWTGTALQEQEVAGQTLYTLGVAVAFAYLFLVALYESLGQVADEWPRFI
jgi:multidrug efflux pump